MSASPFTLTKMDIRFGHLREEEQIVFILHVKEYTKYEAPILRGMGRVLRTLYYTYSFTGSTDICDTDSMDTHFHEPNRELQSPRVPNESDNFQVSKMLKQV